MNPTSTECTSMRWGPVDELKAYQLGCADDYVYDAIAEFEAGGISNDELVDIFGEAYECGDIDQHTYDRLMDLHSD